MLANNNVQFRAAYINDASNVTLHRSATQEQVNLVVIITEPLEVFDDSKGCLAVRHRGVQVVLLAVLVHTETLEGQVPARTKLRLDWTRVEDG